MLGLVIIAVILVAMVALVVIRVRSRGGRPPSDPPTANAKAAEGKAPSTQARQRGPTRDYQFGFMAYCPQMGEAIAGRMVERIDPLLSQLPVVTAFPPRFNKNADSVNFAFFASCRDDAEVRAIEVAVVDSLAGVGAKFERQSPYYCQSCSRSLSTPEHRTCRQCQALVK